MFIRTGFQRQIKFQVFILLENASRENIYLPNFFCLNVLIFILLNIANKSFKNWMLDFVLSSIGIANLNRLSVLLLDYVSTVKWTKSLQMKERALGALAPPTRELCLGVNGGKCESSAVVLGHHEGNNNSFKNNYQRTPTWIRLWVGDINLL